MSSKAFVFVSAFLLFFVSVGFAQITASVRIVPAQSLIQQTTHPNSPALVGEPVVFYCNYLSEASGARIQNAECTITLDGQAIEADSDASFKLEGLKAGAHFWKCSCTSPSYEQGVGQQQLLSVETIDSKNPSLSLNLIEDAENKVGEAKELGKDTGKAEEQLVEARVAFEKRDYASANSMALSSIRLTRQQQEAPSAGLLPPTLLSLRPAFSLSIEQIAMMLFAFFGIIGLTAIYVIFAFKK